MKNAIFTHIRKLHREPRSSHFWKYANLNLTMFVTLYLRRKAAGLHSHGLHCVWKKAAEGCSRFQKCQGSIVGRPTLFRLLLSSRGSVRRLTFLEGALTPQPRRPRRLSEVGRHLRSRGCRKMLWRVPKWHLRPHENHEDKKIWRPIYFQTFLASAGLRGRGGC